MAKIHVFLVGMEGILGEIVRDIVAHQPDMDIVAEVTATRELLPAARSPGPASSLPAWPKGRSRSKTGASSLNGTPVSPSSPSTETAGRRRSIAYDRSECAIGELSPATLIDAIRDPTRTAAGSL